MTPALSTNTATTQPTTATSSSAANPGPAPKNRSETPSKSVFDGYSPSAATLKLAAQMRKAGHLQTTLYVSRLGDSHTLNGEILNHKHNGQPAVDCDVVKEWTNTVLEEALKDPDYKRFYDGIETDDALLCRKFIVETGYMETGYDRLATMESKLNAAVKRVLDKKEQEDGLPECVTSQGHCSSLEFDMALWDLMLKQNPEVLGAASKSLLNSSVIGHSLRVSGKLVAN